MESGKVLLLLGVIVGVLSARPPASVAAIVLDQQSLKGTGPLTPSSSRSSFGVQQQVIAGMSGQLMGFDVMSYAGNAIKARPLYISLGSAWNTTAHVFDYTLTTPTVTPGTWIHIDTTAANINLTAGQQFVIGFGGGGSGSFGLGSTTHAGGDFWGSANFWIPTHDADVRTYMSAQLVVPEPASLVIWSLLGGLGICAGWLRKRKFASLISVR